MKIKTILIASTVLLTGLTACVSSTALAGVTPPVYTGGGSLSYLSVLDALAPMPSMHKRGWWYFTSSLNDQNNNEHSLEVNIIRSDSTLGAYGVGMVGFSFKNKAGKSYYLWNCYGGLKMLPYYAVGSFVSAKTTRSSFDVQVKPLFNDSTYQFKHDPSDTSHSVGQLGAEYDLTASGTAEVGKAESNVQLVHYSFHSVMKDERGFVPEGYGGYVGPTPTNPKLNTSFVSSWEIAAPMMRTVSWKMTISPVGAITATSPVTKKLTFENKIGTHSNIWLDRQALYNKAQSTHPANAGFLSNFIQQYVNQRGKGVINAGTSKQLYYGTWMSFCLNKGGFKGTCGVGVAFWKKGTLTSQMDSDVNANNGFANLYLPQSATHWPPQEGGVLTERLLFKKNKSYTPFRIVNDPSAVFTSPISNRAYGQTVYLSFKKNSVIGSELNLMSPTKKKRKTVVLKFTALSKQTENVMFNDSNGYYEAAAIVSVCKKGEHDCHPVGTGFLEQMGYGSDS